MSTPEHEPGAEELRVALETARELGPEYERQVIDGFLEQIGSSIDARVDARLAESKHGRKVARGRRSDQLTLAIWSIVLGIPLTAIASSNSGLAAVVVVWVAIAVINLANALKR